MEQQQAATLAQLADDVVEMLYDSDDSVRENALVTLCKMKPARLALHADAVAARLEDSVWQVRTVALVTLGELEAATLAKHADAVVGRLEDSNGGRARGSYSDAGKATAVGTRHSRSTLLPCTRTT